MLTTSVMLSLFLAEAPAAAQNAKKAAWTLMVYMDLDNSLEAAGIRNLKDMLKAGGGPDVELVVLCDRSPKGEPRDEYSDEDVGDIENWSGARMLHLVEGRLVEADTWGPTNMADPATLARFLTTAAKRYPAERYGLVVSDHGSGWSGFCVDESADDRVMSLHDLRVALEPFAKDHGKLELVGFDACLMGSFEVAQALAPVAHTMIGSEEVAPARGWNWDALLKSLIGKPSSTGYDLGKAIIDAYTTHFREAGDPLAQYAAMGSTLSMIDLDKLEPLQQAVSAMADACTASLKKGLAGWIRVAKARVASEEYGNMGGSPDAGAEEMHDLVDLARALQQSGDSPTAEAAKEVETAAKAAIRYAMRGTLRPHASGLSIYYPSGGVDLLGSDTKAYLTKTCAKDSRWVNFLSLYAYSANSYGTAPRLHLAKKSGTVATPDHPVAVSSQTPEPDIARAWFVVYALNGPDVLLLGRKPQSLQPDGSMTEQFGGQWYMLCTKDKTITCPFYETEPLGEPGKGMLAHMCAQWRRADRPWRNVSLTFHLTAGDKGPHGQLIYVFADTKEGPRYVELQKGDEIRPVYTKSDDLGGVTTWTPTNAASFLRIASPADLTIEWGQIGKGEYRVGFEVVNLAEQTSVAFTELMLK